MPALEHLVGRRILFLNWRDSSHPQAGGAETYCHEIARRWADAGVEVTLFAAEVAQTPRRGTWDGVAIRRAGGVYGVYAAAALHLRANRRHYDGVVDFQNGIPFYSPAVAGRRMPTVCVIHHVHQDQFDVYFDWPLNVFGRVLEKQVSRMVYRERPIVAVSPSTREDVRRRLGFRNPIFVVPNGAPPPASATVPRTETPTIAVVNRLVPHKRVDLLIRAIPDLIRRWPNLHVDIAGGGTERPMLDHLARGLGVRCAVDFHGHVDEQRKRQLLARAWLTVVPSRAEGWGLTVVEANSMGTPALGFDVPGVRDVIRHGFNGWLVPHQGSLADGIDHALTALSVAGISAPMSERCLTWARSFSWDDSARRLANVMVAELRRVKHLGRSRRRNSDLAVIARFTVEDGDAVERLMIVASRGTDAWIRRGNAFDVLLHGCDEVRALKMLRRLGVEQAAVRLAGRWDVVHRHELALAAPLLAGADAYSDGREPGGGSEDWHDFDHDALARNGKGDEGVVGLTRQSGSGAS
jgi:glycosyltransferase involved in cell wall biosynthesis